MANIETWCCDGKVKVFLAAPDMDRRIVINVEGGTHSGSLRLTTQEAITLRDQLADALTKASIESDAAKATQA